MAIKMDESIVALWYISLDESTDWLCAINRTGGGWEVNYRFRYYCDDSGDPWAEDKKNWFRITITKEHSTEESVIEQLNVMFELLKAKSKGKEAHALFRGTGSFQLFMEEFQALPFVHSKMASEEERAELEQQELDAKDPIEEEVP